MGHVHHHPQLIHPLHHLQPEVAQAPVVALKDAVPDVRLAAVGQAGQPYPRVVQHVHPVQLIADGQVLHGRAGTPLCPAAWRIRFSVRRCSLADHVVVARDVRNHHADLFKQIGEPDEGHLVGVQHAPKYVGRAQRR